MLFLAVFCGFLAENFREKQIEHHREKQFIRSLLIDLQKDKTDLEANVRFGPIPINYNDSLATELQKRPLQGRERRIYHFLLLYTNTLRFTYHDRTISQLKNSGGFRLIGNQKVSDALLDYDVYMKESVNYEESGWSNNIINMDVNLNYKAYELYRVNTLQDSAIAHQNEPDKINYPGDLKLMSYEDNMIKVLLNSMSYNRANDNLKYKRAIISLEMNKQLDSLIKREYHLK